MAFRAMSFNIRGASHPEDGVNHWPQRAPLNVATIRQHAPDLIGFQELERGNLDTYEAELTDYRYILGNDASDHSEHPSIFWKPSALDLLASGGFWISETPEVYSGSWNTDCVRAATWARFRDQASGVTFLYLNTHLDHRSAWARREGCRLIVCRSADLRQPDLPVLLTGDFNCNAHQNTDLADENYRFLVGSGFVDTYLAAGSVDSAHSTTFHDFQGDQFVPEPSEGVKRIDWMLTLDGARRWQVQSAAIIRENAAPIYPSDHYPITAQFSFL
ncbi:MAG TPA: endonuclease/exonuclease/phosphatase family protein [Phototrophicaceae bacterium]|nr:endonuclease/exonuclease/phosphatase family protein [Phototrophicaceae bacterium]